MQVIKDKIRYIGVDDENLDLFEGQYPVPKGISYNSYIIEDDRIAIVDAVDLRRKDQWLSNLADALCGRKP
ncbi:MAG: FprA family A-type flavoprotein, partial [Muribaculaceae bacterium]|nr:FprA family A-type flavoprotein [Muribaculaceae bacterium]